MRRLNYVKKTSIKRYGGRRGSKRTKWTRRRKVTKRGRVSRPISVEVKRIKATATIEGINSVNYGANVCPQLALSPFGSSAGTSVFGLYTVSQGVGQGNRVGNRIQTRRCMLRMVITANPNQLLPNYLIMWIGRRKTNHTEMVPPFNEFLQDGNTATSLTGTVFDTIATVNADLWTIYKRRVWKVGYGSYAGAVNNNFPLTHIVTMDVTRYVQRVISFQDNDPNPTSPITYAFFEAVPADGGIGQAAVNLQAWVDYLYTDV